MASLSQTMDATLSGGNLTAPPTDNTLPTVAQTGLTPDSDPEVQRVKAAWDQLQGMLESGQLKVNGDIHKMFAEEAQKLQNEPTTQAPGREGGRDLPGPPSRGRRPNRHPRRPQRHP